MKMSGGSGSGARKRSWRYTPPLPNDSGNRSEENVRARSPLDSSTSFTQFALSSVLEKLVSEVRSLHALISHNADRENAHYRALLDENRSLKRALDLINARMVRLAPQLSTDESGRQNGADTSQHSNGSAVRAAASREDIVDVEMSDMFALSQSISVSTNQQSEASIGDVRETPRGGYRATIKSEYFDSVLSAEEALRAVNHGNRSRSTSSRSRELIETTENMQKRTLASSGEVRDDRRMNKSRTSTRSNIRMGSVSSPGGEGHRQGEGDEHDNDDEEDDVRPKERVIVRPLPTDLPKPTTFRVAGYRGQSKMTDEWKEYALSIYPIRPHQYWDIRKEDYEALIPDQYLEEFKKEPTDREKNALIRSIYDWFRHQHKIAQLKVVLSECTTAMDVDSLQKVYVEKMKQRGWPIYGKKLRKCDVTVARRQLIESFVDTVMPVF